MGYLRGADTQQGAHQIGAVPAEDDDVWFVLDAAQAVDRIIDVFPAFRQDQIRVQLGSSLGAVVAQRLVPRLGGGMVACFEILIANNPVRNIIREGKTHQLPNLITTNQAEGMCSLETSLAELVAAQIVDYEDAVTITSHPKELARQVGQRLPAAATA